MGNIISWFRSSTSNVQPSPVAEVQDENYLLNKAADAVEYTRRALSLGAANKVRLGAVSLPANEHKGRRTKEENYKQVASNIVRVRRGLIEDAVLWKFFEPGAAASITIRDIDNYAARVRFIQTGVCSDHAVVAFYYLYLQRCRPLELLTLPTDDHVIVRLGEARAPGFYSAGSGFVSNNAVICDPWANIVCRASEYVGRYNLKMLKWSGVGKEYVKYNPQTKTLRTDSFTTASVTGQQRVIFSVSV